jgi:hypothetical protein
LRRQHAAASRLAPCEGATNPQEGATNRAREGATNPQESATNRAREGATNQGESARNQGESAFSIDDIGWFLEKRCFLQLRLAKLRARCVMIRQSRRGLSFCCTRFAALHWDRHSLLIPRAGSHFLSLQVR